MQILNTYIFFLFPFCPGKKDATPASAWSPGGSGGAKTAGTDAGGVALMPPSGAATKACS